MYSSFYTRKTQIGTRGQDVLVGQRRGGEIYGGRGDDLLIAGGHTDVLHGGSGADTFSLKPVTTGSAPIRHHLLDFNPDEGDVIDLASLVGRGGDFLFLGKESFTGGDDVEVRFSNRQMSRRRHRRRDVSSAGFSKYSGFSKQVEFALNQALGDIPDVPGKLSRRKPLQLEIDVDADKRADYIFQFEASSFSSRGKYMRRAVKRSSSSYSFLSASLPSKKAEKSCLSITQSGIPIPGLDSYLTFSPTFDLSISSSTHQPSISCPFSINGLFGATLPLGVKIGGKIGIMTGSLAGTTKLPVVKCELAEYELPTDPPLTAEVSALLAVGADLTVSREGLNKQIGVSLGVDVGATQRISQSNSGFQDSLFNVYATQYSVPSGYKGKGIDLSITMNPPEDGNLAAEVGLGVSIPGTETCQADIIDGVMNFGFPLELEFKNLSSPELTLGAEIGVVADILKVSCGPYSLIAKQFPIASFNVLKALTGEDSIVIVGENGIFSN